MKENIYSYFWKINIEKAIDLCALSALFTIIIR